MRRMYGLWGAALLLALAGTAQAEDKCRQILDKAMTAHGAAKAEKLPAAVWKGKGTLHLVGMNIPFTGEWHLVGKDKMRIALRLEIAGESVQVMDIYNGTQGWAAHGDDINDMDEVALTEMKEAAHLNWAQNLYPLKEPAYKLSTVPDITLDGRAAEGFKVSRDGHRDFTFYFDAQTHLLVKCLCQARDEQTRELVNQEEFYSNYKDVEGIKVPMTCRVKRAGEDFLEIETAEFRLVEKLDDKLFQKPEK